MSGQARPQPLTSQEIVGTTLSLLARVGLPDLTMRAIGAELGVQQSALYHHFANKQALLGAAADAILLRGPRTAPPTDATWQERVRLRCTDLHAAVTAYPDGADLVMSMWAFGVGAAAPVDELCDLLTDAGLDDADTPTAARALLHFVYGHAYDEQSHAQAARSGIASAERVSGVFDTGLDIVVDGIEARSGG
ncbi:TetR/AcrR family transcriptional regulator C-terminal domain-containing protein [Janibacter anophelis]|uniref:TetR/AcrR family transcriptional regulator C-terminal domain-containing protein n=1 Tax=Janibacter anophelis TaxID=319054 RepID=UPI00082A85F7|nr:TetR/AcrR family transcriptional regulator C-terminal domain-containing protein [Janibacter anophelis]